MDFFDSRYFSINKFFLSSIGLWPYDSCKRNKLIQTIVISSILIFFIPTVSGLCKVWGKVDLVIDCFIPIATTFACLVYTLAYIFNERKIRYLLDCIKSDWELFSSAKEFNALLSHAEIGRNLTLLYTGMVSTTAVTYVIMTMAPQILNIIIPLNESRPKQLPFPVEYFVNYEEYFNYILLHVSIIVALELCIIVGCKATFAGFVEHACGLFSLIGLRFQNVMKSFNFEKAALDSNLEHAIFTDLIICIKHHKRAIAYSESIETCFSTCFFFITGVDVLLISTSLSQIIFNMDKFYDVIKYGCYAIGMIIDLYFNNLPAQQMLDYSVIIADYIEDSLWYQLPLKSKKLLLMIILRSTVPCSLTAGKVYFMSMSNFGSISFSYFTLMSSLRN